MNDIFTVQKDIISNFKLFEEWNDKFEYLIEFGKTAGLEDFEKVDENLVQGCQSRVWVLAEVTKGNIKYRVDGDAPIPLGLACILVRILSDRKVEEVVTAEIDFHTETGLKFSLSPNRARGLESMISRFKELAAIIAAK